MARLRGGRCGERDGRVEGELLARGVRRVHGHTSMETQVGVRLVATNLQANVALFPKITEDPSGKSPVLIEVYPMQEGPRM